MDPVSALGVAAAAAQFADMATTIFYTLYKYVRDVKQAPKHSEELQHEIFLLSIVLRDLKSSTNSMGDASPTTLKDELKTTITEFSKIMTDLNARVEVKPSEWIKRMKWPFNEKENKEWIAKLERFKSMFCLWLNTIQTYNHFGETNCCCSTQLHQMDHSIHQMSLG
jgi:hypothetical protein